MDRATTAARVGRGLGIAADVLGREWQVYRPADPMAPIGTPIMTVQAAIASDVGYSMRRVAGFGEAARYLLGDASGLAVGDYLIADGRRLFVAAVDGIEPTLLVECNATVQFYAWQVSAGYADGAQAVVAQGWPVSLLIGGSGGVDVAKLPGDARATGWRALAPVIAGVSVASGWQFSDDRGQRFLVGGVEAGPMGLRVSATYAGS